MNEQIKEKIYYIIIFQFNCIKFILIGRNYNINLIPKCNIDLKKYVYITEPSNINLKEFHKLKRRIK